MFYSSSFTALIVGQGRLPFSSAYPNKDCRSPSGRTSRDAHRFSAPRRGRTADTSAVAASCCPPFLSSFLDTNCYMFPIVVPADASPTLRATKLEGCASHDCLSSSTTPPLSWTRWRYFIRTPQMARSRSCFSDKYHRKYRKPPS